MVLRCTVLVAAIAAAWLATPPTAGASPDAPSVRIDQQRVVPRTRSEITLSFAPVVRQAAPAVVNIYTKTVVARRRSPFAGDPFFERFFSDMFPNGGARRIENSLGSGVILDPSGIVVSNYHVVGEADEITVILQDRREYRGEVIFSDAPSDLAVLQLDGALDLPSLSIRDSDTLEVGDLVLAIGNPFGFGQTVTSGIISGLGRSREPRGSRAGGVFIQTDAAINPGNSGGALVDMQGRLVGISTAIVSRSGGSNGIGFAVPANLVARVVASAQAGNWELARPWLGFDGQAVDGDLATAIGLSTPRGVLIDALHPDAPLSALGLQRGDVITVFDGVSVNTVEEIEFRAATAGLGASVTLDYLREDSAGRARVALSPAPDHPPRDFRELDGRGGLPGLTIINVNPAVIDEFGLGIESAGVLVLRAVGPSRRVGLRRGDFLRKVDGTSVGTVAEAVSRFQESRGQTVLQVERAGRLGMIRYVR